MPVALIASTIIALALENFEPIKVVLLSLVILIGIFLTVELYTIIFLTSSVHSVDGTIFLSGIEPATSANTDKTVNSQPYYTLNIGEDYFYTTYAVYNVLKPYE